MVVCSHCQFENPGVNKFCQQCGAPLKLLLARISSVQADPVSAEAVQTSATREPSESVGLSPLKPAIAAAKGDYLDAEQRYQLQETLDLSQPQVEVQVLDTQPDEPISPPLSELRSGEAPINRADLPELIPAEAYPYLVLQDRFFPSIPELQDAWLAGGYSVILIEDRSDLPALATVWQQASLDPLQQLHCFYLMSELWEMLLPYHGQGSLLKLGNLCIDEDQIFCLRRIERTANRSAHTLQDLGLLWQALLQSSSEPLAPLVALANLVTAGEINQIEALKSELIALADSLQTNEAERESFFNLESDLPDFSEAEALKPEDFVEGELELEENPDLPTIALPMKLIGLEEAGQTHVGQQREHNEDNYLIQSQISKQEGIGCQTMEARCLYVLCDGMGGHAGGEVASRLAVETLSAYFSEHWSTELPEEWQLREAIAQANQKIYEMNEVEARSGSARMGTTLVMLLVDNARAVAAHVGDSRLYRYTRRLDLQQLTVDHEVGQREIQRGVEPAIAYARPDAYQLTQALGPRDQAEIDPSITYLEFNEDTLLLLCSDGLSDRDLLEENCDSHISPMLRGSDSLDAGVSNLIELANEINGHDNITAIALKLRVKPDLDKMQLKQTMPPS
ncbi:MAG: serine/threonine phosphatase [Leptolyngbya sp. SIO4C1]|nr:serine/threonine phosphatase [Leptolyngbya sp. SIO4C1]